MVVQSDLSGRVSADVVDLGRGVSDWTTPHRMPGICGIAADAAVQTEHGLVAIEHLLVGDKIKTISGKLVAVAAHALHLSDKTSAGSCGGVRIAKGALGPHHPREDMIVGAGQHVRLTSATLIGLCGHKHGLVEAQDLVGLPGVTWSPATSDPLVILVLSEPALFEVGGLVCPGFVPTQEALDAVSAECREDLLTQAPRLRYAGASEALATTLPIIDDREALAALGIFEEEPNATILHIDRTPFASVPRQQRA